jgi:hypothetical protein
MRSSDDGCTVAITYGAMFERRNRPRWRVTRTLGLDDISKRIYKAWRHGRWTIEVIPAAERKLKALPDDLQGKFLHVAGLLEEFGPTRLGLPHVDRSAGNSGRCAWLG